MKMLTAGLVGGGIVAAFALIGGEWQPNGTVTADATLRPAAQDSFMVILGGRDTGCSVVVEKRGLDRAGGLRLGDACAETAPEMAGLRFWAENADGSISFGESEGKAVYSFAAADGAAYESYDPQTPLISLISSD